MAYSNYLGEVPDPEDLRAALGNANRFTLVELAQNRAGRIADSQMLTLAAQALRPFWSALIVLGGWLLFLFVIRVFVPDLILTIASVTFGKSITGLFLVITLGCAV